jgi:metallo-beta-lactamase family protein
MRISFLGAAQEVTGSKHLIEVNGKKLLLECGLYQGHRDETYDRNLNFPFKPSEIDAVVLSHAHIDHAGNLPNLVKQGFRGNIWCTTATRNLSTYMLQDSAHIQESDISYLNRKRLKNGEPPIVPLYTKVDAQAALEQFASIGFDRPVFVMDGVQLTFHNAAHILGAAFVVLDIREFDTGKQWRVVFSADVGRDEVAILKPLVAPPPDADIVIMESTYGDRLHETMEDARQEARSVIRSTARRRGKVIIPSFAVGRTQEVIYAINMMEAESEIPVLPVFVDSPLAVNATEVFRLHPEEWDEDVQAFLLEEKRSNPFETQEIEYVRDARRSRQLNFLTEPAIIISASGMAESGRILHHLKHNIEDEANTVLFVGFQAQDTLGRRIKDGESPVRIFGQMYDVRARVASIEGLSAHADQAELLEWARHFDRSRLQHTFLVHGEPAAALVLAEKLRSEGVSKVSVPSRGNSFEF